MLLACGLVRPIDFEVIQPEGVPIMVLLEFSMTPLGKGTSVSPYVARSLEIVEASGLDYRLHSMGTIVEMSRKSPCLMASVSSTSAAVRRTFSTLSTRSVT